MLILAAAAVPNVLVQGRREREEETIWRGEQYQRVYYDARVTPGALWCERGRRIVGYGGNLGGAHPTRAGRQGLWVTVTIGTGRRSCRRNGQR